MTKYIVATSNGGLMECPEVYYDKFQLIEADSEDLARKIYNDKNNCNFFYGAVICTFNTPPENLEDPCYSYRRAQ